MARCYMTPPHPRNIGYRWFEVQYYSHRCGCTFYDWSVRAGHQRRSSIMRGVGESEYLRCFRIHVRKRPQRLADDHDGKSCQLDISFVQNLVTWSPASKTMSYAGPYWWSSVQSKYLTSISNPLGKKLPREMHAKLQLVKGSNILLGCNNVREIYPYPSNGRVIISSERNGQCMWRPKL